MSLTVPKEPLCTLVASLSGVPITRVYWEGEPEKHIGPVAGRAGKISLNVTAIAENGTLEPRRNYVATPTPDQTTEWGAHETVTISIRADNFLGHGEAFHLLRKVRFGLKLPSSRAALRAADLAFIDAPLIVARNNVVDTRAVSSATLDVRFAHVVSDVPGVDGHEGWIEKVSSESYPPGNPATAPEYELEFTKVE